MSKRTEHEQYLKDVEANEKQKREEEDMKNTGGAQFCRTCGQVRVDDEDKCSVCGGYF